MSYAVCSDGGSLTIITLRRYGKAKRGGNFDKAEGTR